MHVMLLFVWNNIIATCTAKSTLILENDVSSKCSLLILGKRFNPHEVLVTLVIS